MCRKVQHRRKGRSGYGRLPGMSRELGELMRALRRKRGLAMETAAVAAGVARSTLYRWERGETQPRLPELEATLKALGASSLEQRQALERLEAPRALHRLQADWRQQPMAESALGPIPSCGD